jgi:hypothetical protein
MINVSWGRVFTPMARVPLALAIFFASPAIETSATPVKDFPGLRSVPAAAMSEGGLFFPGNEEGKLLAAPLLVTEIEADVSGIVARAFAGTS